MTDTAFIKELQRLSKKSRASKNLSDNIKDLCKAAAEDDENHIWVTYLSATDQLALAANGMFCASTPNENNWIIVWPREEDDTLSDTLSDTPS